MVGISGALAFIVYKTFMQKDAGNTSKVDESVSVGSEFKTYNNSSYSFDFPKSGWYVTTESSGSNRAETVYLRSDDYRESQSEFGILTMDRGASISIYEDVDYVNVKNMVNSYNNRGWITDLKTLAIDSQEAYSFHFIYEYPRYSAYFEKNSKTYSVTLKVINEQYDGYMSAYDLVNSSLHVK